MVTGLVVVVAWLSSAWALQGNSPGERRGGQRPGAQGQRGWPGRGPGFERIKQRFDANKDGKVTKEEWTGPQQMFGRMDRNSDGVITAADFEGRGGRPGGPGGPRGGAPGLDAAGLFRLLDADKDGKVSKDELEKFFRQCDSNKDGSLNEDELRKALAREPAVEIKGLSVVEGQKAGIQVGQYAPDFELQPVQPYPSLRRWLGDDAPQSIEHGIKLSQLVGKAPIMLFFGSFT